MKDNSPSDVYWLLRQWRNRMVKDYGPNNFRVELMNGRIARIQDALMVRWCEEQDAA